MTFEASFPAHDSSGAPAHVESAPGSPVPMGTPVATGAKIRTRRLPLIDVLTLFAIGVVVVLVSLPRLRSFALRENELDAMHMLRTLSSQPAAPGVDARSCNLAALLAPDPALRRKLEDLELLPDGRVRRHGYLFDLVLLGPGQPMLRAWPWKHGQTGRAAFVWSPERGLVGCDNRDGRFSGPEHAPWAAEPIARAEDWVRLPRR